MQSSISPRLGRHSRSIGRRTRADQLDSRFRPLRLESLEDRRMLSMGPIYWLLPGQHMEVGTTPTSVVAADVSGDGTPDLITSNWQSNNVSVLLGQGGGMFEPQTTFDVGDSPWSVVAADLNNDDIPDLVTANASSGNVSVLLGHGDGTFDEQTVFDVGVSPRSVAIADFDGDGVQDLVTANEESDDVSVLLGCGDGTFDPQTTFDVGVSPWSVAIADFDGDGMQDLVTANKESDDVSVLLGRSDRTFGEQTTYDVGFSPRSVAIADFDGDGVQDLVTANEESDDVSVLLGHGKGKFDEQTTFSVGISPCSVAVADFDGDGTRDLVTANSGNGTVSVLSGDGEGSFEPQLMFVAGYVPYSVAVNDINGDGVSDVVTADYEVNTVVVLSGRVEEPPELAWSTYLGGSSGEEIGDNVGGICVNADGSTNVAGTSEADDLAERNNDYKGGFCDAFMANVAPQGGTSWATYLGGSESDWIRDLAMDAWGNVYLAGTSSSPDFKDGETRSSFVAKVSPDGELLQPITYLDGSVEHIAVDALGSAYVAGWDALHNFVIKVPTEGPSETLVQVDALIHDIAVDLRGNVYLTGESISGAFVGKVSPGGTLKWTTNLGGSGADIGNSIAVDTLGNALVTGLTSSTDFEGANNTAYGDTDTFVAKVSSDGSLQWATYLGGSASDSGSGIAVDAVGSALVTGRTSSADFTKMNNDYGGKDDAFVAKVSPGGQPLWASYLGGSNLDESRGIALDLVGNALVTGHTQSTNLPKKTNDFIGGLYDILVAKFPGAADPSDAGDILATARGLGTLDDTASITLGSRIGDGFYGAADVDLYKFTTSQAGHFELHLTTSVGELQKNGLPLDGYVRLFDAGGNQIVAGKTTYDQGEVSVTLKPGEGNLLPKGTYYVGVSGYDNLYYDPADTAGRREASTGAYVVELKLDGVDAGITVQGVYDGNPDPNIIGRFLVGECVDELNNTFTVDVIPEEGYTPDGVMFDSNFNGEREEGIDEYVAGNSNWSWTTDVSGLTGGNETLRVWAHFSNDAWSKESDFVIETLAVSKWIEDLWEQEQDTGQEYISIAFNTAEEYYDIDGLIGKRFGKDTPSYFPKWLRERNGEPTWNGVYAGMLVDAYARLSGTVVTEEVVPVVGMSFLGIDLPLRVKVGSEARTSVDLFKFLDLCKDSDASGSQNEANPSKKRAVSPQVTFWRKFQVALDDELNFSQFQFDVGMELSASGTAFSLDLPPVIVTIPAFPAVSLVITPEIGWSPLFSVGMKVAIGTDGGVEFDGFSVYVGAKGTVGVSAEIAIAGGLASGGIKAAGSLDIGFKATYDTDDWILSIPLGLGLDFSFVGSVLYGLFSGEFPIYSFRREIDLLELFGAAAPSALYGTESAGMLLSEATGEDLLADGAIARSDSGEIGYAWTPISQHRTTASRLNFQLFPDQSGKWGETEEVIGSEHHRGQPALVSLGEDRWMVLWSQSNLTADQLEGLSGEEVMAAQEIWYAVREPGGWAAAQRLTNNAVCDDSPAIVRRNDGTVMAVWRRMSGTDLADIGASNLVYAFWDDDQDTWTPAVFADTAASLAEPQLATLPDGTVVATWLSDTTGYWDEENESVAVEKNEGEELTGGVTVWSAVYDGTGWSTSERISDWEGGWRTWPQVVALPDGRALALWTEQTSEGDVLMTALRDPATGQWDKPERATEPQRMAGKPQMVVDGSIVRVVYNGYNEMAEDSVDIEDPGEMEHVDIPELNEIVVISRDFADPDGDWSEPEPLSQEGETAWWGSMAVDDDGYLLAKYAAGSESKDGSMLVAPDLKVSSGELALAVTPAVLGGQNGVEVLIVNRGQAASGATTVALYDDDPATAGTLLVQEPLPALAIGESTTVSLPWTPEDAGRYTLFVVVDDQALVWELHEDNNAAEIKAGALLTPTVALSQASDTGIVGDGRTTDTDPEVVGTAALATTVAVFVDTQDWPVAYADVNGDVYAALLPELDLGMHTVWVQAFDEFGDGSPMSEPFELFIEKAMELEPVAWLELDEGSDSGEAGDGLTNVTRPEFVGWGLPSATVLLYSGDTLVGETMADGQGGFTVAPTAGLADSLHTFTVVQQDQVGNESSASSPLEVMIDATPPTVDQVLVRSTAWSNDFLDDLDAAGLGHPTIPRLGYRLPDGDDQMDALPWTDLDTISVDFSENVIVGAENLALSGQDTGPYGIATGGFHYDSATSIAAWTFTKSIAVDSLLLAVSDAVTDPAGSRLDGDWTDRQSKFPSGDGTAGSDFEMSFIVAQVEPIELGVVDFKKLSGLNLTEDNVWYRFTVAHPGILTASVSSAGGTVEAGLYAAQTEPPLAVSTGTPTSQRLDQSAVVQGEIYLLKVSGNSSDASLTVANLVNHANTTLTVYGTAQDDDYAFDANASWKVTVNGIEYTIGSAEIESISFDTGAGLDTVQLDDSPGDDTVEIGCLWVTASGPGYTLEGSNFELLYARATAEGNDKVILKDSEKENKFKYNPNENFAMMYCGGLYNRAESFEAVEVEFSQGGETELVRMWDTPYDDILEGHPGDFRFYSNQTTHDITIRGADFLVVYSTEGNDTLDLHDSPGNDVLCAKPHKIQLFNRNSQDPFHALIARNFEDITIAADMGGDHDIAKLHDSTLDTLWEAGWQNGQTWSKFSSSGQPWYEVFHFEKVRGYAHDEGNSVLKKDAAVDFIMKWGVWEDWTKSS